MLETIASDVADNYGNNFQINLVLDDVVKNNPAPSVEGLLFWRYADDPAAEFKPMGTATVGQEFTFPFEFPDGREIELSVVAKTANGEQSAVNPMDGKFYRFAPNRETGTPDFSQNGTALNLQINFIATGYSVAKFRKIQYADDSGFTTNLVEKIEGNLNQPLSPNFNITRPGPAASTKTVYVRIAHSTTNQNFDTWSAAKQMTFADNGGSGGSGGGTPPSNLYGYLRYGGAVDLYFTDGSGTNEVYRNGVSLGSASGSFSDTLVVAGFYDYWIQNADGSSNSIQFYYSGNEF